MDHSARLNAAARITHETLRALQTFYGDPTPSGPWEEEPLEVRASAFAGARRVAEGMTDPGALHQGWMDDKLAAGWTHGPVKDPEARTHPCLLPWDQLPEHQRLKDVLFVATVSAALDTL